MNESIYSTIRKRPRSVVFATLLLPITLVGCGGGGSGSTNTTRGEFSIASVMPADGATQVARGTPVTVSFSAAVDCATIDPSAFSITAAAGASVSGRFSCSGSQVSFTPDTALAELTTYAATVTTAARGAGGTGIKADYTWSFTTASRPWGTAQLMEQNSPDVWNPVIAADGGGGLTADWLQADGSNHQNVLSSSYTPGVGWSGGVILNDVAGDPVANSVIAVNTSGAAVAFWAANGGNGNYYLWASRRSPAGTWNTPALLVTISGYPFDLQAALDDIGNATVVLYMTYSNTQYLYSVHYSSSNIVNMDMLRSGNLQHAKLSMDASGNAAVTWQEWDATAQVDRIWSRHFDTTMSWSTPLLLSAADSTEDATEPTLASDPQGNMLSAWVQYDAAADDYHVWWNRYDATSGAWGTAQPLGDALVGAGDPMIAMNTSGDAALTWYAENATSSFAATAFYAATNTQWTAPQPISDGLNSTWNGKIALDSAGNAEAIWVEYDDAQGVNRIWSNRYVAGAGVWSGAEPVSGAGGGALGAELTLDAYGNAIVLWQQYEGNAGVTPIDLWTRRLE